MKVLQVTNGMSSTISSGGVEVVVRNIHNALKEYGYSCKVTSMATASDMPDEANDLDYEIHVAPRLFRERGWSQFSFSAIRNLVTLIRNAEMIHIHLCMDFYTVCGLFFCRIFRKAVVVQTHGMIAPKENATGKFAVKIVRKLVSNTKMLCLTEMEMLQLDRMGFRGQKFQVPNPIDTGRFKPYYATQRATDILFLSRFHPRKRPQLLVKATKLLVDSGREVKVTMAGPDDGVLPETLDLTRHLDLRNVISFPGSIPRPQIELALMNTKVFVLPSYGEIFPMAALEAASTCTPMILGPDCPLAVELSEQGAALLADSPEELACQIERILCDEVLANNLARNAHRWLQGTCSYRVYTATVTSIYRSL